MAEASNQCMCRNLTEALLYTLFEPIPFFSWFISPWLKPVTAFLSYRFMVWCNLKFGESMKLQMTCKMKLTWPEYHSVLSSAVLSLPFSHVHSCSFRVLENHFKTWGNTVLFASQCKHLGVTEATVGIRISEHPKLRLKVDTRKRCEIIKTALFY